MKRLYRFYPVFVIMFVWFMFSSPFLLRGLVPFPSRYLVTFFQPWQPYYGMPSKNNAMPDIITQIYPWRYHSIESIKQGGFGLWNPYSFGGTVHAGNYQSAVFQPLNALFFFLPFLYGWSLLVLLQPLCAGLFMYLYMYSLLQNKRASLFSSIAFMFCGFLTVWMAYGTLGWAVCYFPLVLFALERSNKRFSSLLLSIGIGFSFLSGHFQMSMYVFLVSLMYAFYKGKVIFIKSLPFFGLGLLLALPQLALSVDAYLVSDRSSSFIENAGIPLHYLITLFAPDFFGNPVTRNDWYGQYAEWSSYIGVLPLLFAGIVFFIKKNSIMRFYIGLLLLSLSLSLLSPISQIFYALRIPVLSTSVATRMIVMVSFSLCVLAGVGFNYFLQLKNITMSKKSLLSFFSIGALVLLLIYIIQYSGLLIGDQIIIARRNILLSLFYVVVFIVIWILWNIKRMRNIIVIGIILLTALDVLRFSTKWMPFEEAEYVYPKNPLISFLSSQESYGKVFSNIGNEMYTMHKLQSIEGYDAMYQSRYAELISSSSNGRINQLERSVVKVDRQGKHTKDLFDLLGVTYVIHRLSDGRNVWVFPHWSYPQLKSVYKDDHYEVFKNSSALPKVYFVQNVFTETEPNTIIDRMYKDEVLIGKQAIIEKSIDEKEFSADGVIDIESVLSHELVVKTETTSSQFLVFSDAYNHAWKAYVNDKPTEIYRTNYALQGVLIPSGSSTVRFVYRPDSFYIGIAGMMFAFFVLGFIGMRELKYEHRFL